MSPLVSVVIPTFNCERYIDATLAAVLAQTYRPIEVLVVDDGSTDSTAEHVAGYGPPVRLFRNSNQGVCKARNFGFSQSTGDYVCFLDHDDHWFPWKLGRQVQAFAEHRDAGVVFTAFEFWNPVDGEHPAPERLAPVEDGPPPLDPVMSGWVYHQFLLDCWALTSTAMIRREACEASGGFDPTLPYSEDWDLWLRLSRQYPFIKLNRVSTLYRQHPTQGSRTVRGIDYRTRLLWAARERWGLSSRDGRSISAAEFDRNIAIYHMQFGLHHLQHRNRRIALRALAKAWRTDPRRLKYGLLFAAALAGWTPRG